MDRKVRTAIQRATQRMRALLEADLAGQLEGTFDIFADGTVNHEPGAHLDAQQRLVRGKLVAAIAHMRAKGQKPAEAVATYQREAAFTFLNRLVALKLAEVRGLVQECVSRGDQSSGFREFCGLAPGLAQLPDHGYRLYLESLFDELGREVGVLFDRREPASLCWPGRPTFAELLAALNHQDLQEVWILDETIGWVYQYFNSKDERALMRDAAAAPRNSRELAVRNQFFTPRYVVELLTDNTLGRIWYEMRRGETTLARRCTYLVRRPGEVFLARDQAGPAPPPSTGAPITEGMSRTPQVVPHRPKKDPREIRMIDPAGGSGHFALYCFDLFEVIYRESWNDPDLGAKLHGEFSDQAAFELQIPRFILKHNLHLVDIDPRACQIAALALWMRAQRTWQTQQIPAAQRPRIEKVNVVCAEPMPGEQELLDELVASLNPPVLGQLVRVMFDQMRLAGEAGSLLKIEQELDAAVTAAHREWQTGGGQEQLSLFPEAAAPRQLGLFDVRGISEEQFWPQAEARVLAALRSYASRASDHAKSARRLFAHDAAHGFGLFDLCRVSYDVALMNPPFGAASTGAKAYIDKAYPRSKNDLLATFVERWLDRLGPGGRLGAITSRTAFFLSSFQKWREEIVLGAARPAVFVDLGYGVMDDAMVEAAAYVLEKV